MLNQKSLLMSVAVLAAFTLTTTGCGKSKESRNDGTKQVETQQTDIATGEDVTALDPQTNPLPLADSSTSTAEPLPKAENGGADTLPLGSQNPVKNKKTNKALNAKFDEAEAVKTGGKSDTLNYTSSAADGLMSEFRSYNNKVNAQQKEMNLNLAKVVTNAKLTRSSGNSMIVDLNLDESLNGVKKITSYRLQATQSGDKYSLTKVSSNGDLEFQGGFLKCTDADGGCDNSYIKVKMSGAYVRVIFRKSYADRYFVFEQGSQGSSFEMWKSYLTNTVTGASTSQKLNFVQTSSFEVVNGRSAMGVLIATEDKETVGLSVPLLAADKGTQVGSTVTKVSDLSKLYDLSYDVNGSQNLAKVINAAKLMNNNGQGEVRIRLDVSSGTQSAAIWLTLSNNQKATLSIAEIQGFENKVAKF